MFVKGWESVYNSPGNPNLKVSPHYQSYIWAVYLWAYSKSGYLPFYERAHAGLEYAMSHFPSRWIPTSNGIGMQRARILLPLAFLVRVNDTALHRQWLQTAVDGFLTRSHCPSGASWCAFKEELNHTGWGGSTRVPNNEDYVSLKRQSWRASIAALRQRRESLFGFGFCFLPSLCFDLCLFPMTTMYTTTREHSKPL